METQCCNSQTVWRTEKCRNPCLGKSIGMCTNRQKTVEKKNATVADHQVASDQPTDDLDVLLAGAPGGKLVVSRDSYHDLPRSVQGAFKRDDPRIVVVESFF